MAVRPRYNVYGKEIIPSLPDHDILFLSAPTFSWDVVDWAAYSRALGLRPTGGQAPWGPSDSGIRWRRPLDAEQARQGGEVDTIIVTQHFYEREDMQELYLAALTRLRR